MCDPAVPRPMDSTTTTIRTAETSAMSAAKSAVEMNHGDPDVLDLKPLDKIAELKEGASSMSSHTSDQQTPLDHHWQVCEFKEEDQLREAASSCRLLDETQVALIPRFPPPWQCILRPPFLPPWLPFRDLAESLNYHPLVDSLSRGGPDQHARHRRLWQNTSSCSTFDAQGSKTSCGNPQHHRRICVQPPRQTDQSVPAPCPYCKEDHGFATCVVLHTRCKVCDNLGHYTALCNLHSRREWYHHSLIFAHLGLLTGTNELEPQLGRFRFGYVGKEISEHPTIRRLEAEATEQILGTMSMLSDGRNE